MKRTAALLCAPGLWLSCAPEVLWLSPAASTDGGLPDASLDASVAADAAPICPGGASPPTVSEQSQQLSTGSAFAGTFSAEVQGEQAQYFPANQLQLVLSATEPSSLRFVQSAPSNPEPLSPSAFELSTGGYLCGDSSPWACGSDSGFVSSVVYPLTIVAERQSTLSVSVPLNSPWQPWCAAQSPVRQPSSSASCPDWFGVAAPFAAASRGRQCSVQRDGQWQPIDCQRLATLELDPCDCSAERCWSNAARAMTIHLARNTTNSLQGAIWFGSERALPLDWARTAAP